MLVQNRDLILVDEEDEWLLFNYNWSITAHGYVVRSELLDGRWMPTYLHHYVMGQPIWKGDEIDHINRNGYDNRRANLRYVTHQENMQNALHPLGATGARGVTQLPNGRYKAQLKRHSIHHNIGVYDTIAEAVAAREDYIAWMK